jgi:hypothetical protein
MVNAGVSGYGTDQQFLLMKRLWNDVNPKYVVLTFCVDNDRDDNTSSYRYRKYHKPYFVPGKVNGRFAVIPSRDRPAMTSRAVHGSNVLPSPASPSMPPGLYEIARSSCPTRPKT